jgi:hypothetical protein
VLFGVADPLRGLLPLPAATPPAPLVIASFMTFMSATSCLRSMVWPDSTDSIILKDSKAEESKDHIVRQQQNAKEWK